MNQQCAQVNKQANFILACIRNSGPAGLKEWFSPVVSTDKATPRVLYPVLGLSLQEGLGGAGVTPEKGNGAGEGCGTYVL